MHWSQIYGLPAVSLRFFNVYGTRSRTSGTYGAVFGVFLAQRLANSALTVVGDGNQTRDFTYVTDVTRAILAAALSDKSGHVYNVGSGQTVSINRMAELIGGDSVFIPKGLVNQIVHLLIQQRLEENLTGCQRYQLKKASRWCLKISTTGAMPQFGRSKL